MSSPSYAAAGQHGEPHESVPLGAAALSRLECNVAILEESIATILAKLNPVLEDGAPDVAGECSGGKRSSAEVFFRIENSAERLCNLANLINDTMRRIEF